jgi:hypothetical protein
LHGDESVCINGTREVGIKAVRIHIPISSVGRVNVKASGRLLDGQLHDGYPEVRS